MQKNHSDSFPSNETEIPSTHRRAPSTLSIPATPQTAARRQSLDDNPTFGDTQHDGSTVFEDIASPTEQQTSLRAPFFTVIHDTTTGEHHHPHVHYVFSDDDPDVITNAILRTLDPDGTAAQTPTSATVSDDRYVIIDLAADGQTVLSAKSLDPNWQILGTSVTVAPTFDESSTTDEAGMMLRVEGVESSPISHPTHDVIEGLLRFQETGVDIDGLTTAMNALAEQYQSELSALQKLTISEHGTSS